MIDLPVLYEYGFQGTTSRPFGGRIDFGRQLSRARTPMPISYRFGEFTANLIEDRGLRAAIRTSLKAPAYRGGPAKAHAGDGGYGGGGGFSCRRGGSPPVTTRQPTAQYNIGASHTMAPVGSGLIRDIS